MSFQRRPDKQTLYNIPSKRDGRLGQTLVEEVNIMRELGVIEFSN